MRELKVDRTIREIIPALTEDEYKGLEDDIKRRGCRHPIDVWKGKGIILDGHNRYDICINNGITFEINEIEFATKSEALDWMISNQLNRRNLSDANRIELALKRAKLRNASPCQQLTREGRKEIAKDLKVSETNVTKVKVVQDEGTKEVKKELHDGKISIDKAYKETRGIEAKEDKLEGIGFVRADKLLKGEAPPVPQLKELVITEIPDGFEKCSKCGGKGYTRKEEKKKGGIQADGSWLCGFCGRAVYLQVELLKVCPGCGEAVVK